MIKVLNSTDFSFVASYTYDATGRRTSKTTPEGTTRYIYNDITAVLSSEQRNGQNLSFIGDTDEYGKLVSLIVDGVQYFYVYNGNDEIIGLTDSSGAFAVRYSYDSWGNPTEYDASGNIQPLGTFQNPYIYKTYYYDTETNLYYLNARYYDSSIGRFLTRDPDLGDDTDRLSKNEYIYAFNNPIVNDDPNGHGFWSWGKSLYKKAKKYVNKKYKQVKKYVSKKVSNTKKWVSKKVNSAKKWVAKKYNSAKNWAKKTYTKAKTWAKKTATKVVRAIKKTARKVINKVTRAIEKKVTKTLNKGRTVAKVRQALNGKAQGNRKEFEKRTATMKQNNKGPIGDLLEGIYRGVDDAAGLAFGDGSSMDQLHKAISDKKYMKGKTWEKYQNALKNDDAIAEVRYRTEWEKETFPKAAKEFSKGKDGARWRRDWEDNPSDIDARSRHKVIVEGVILNGLYTVSKFLDEATR